MSPRRLRLLAAAMIASMPVGGARAAASVPIPLASQRAVYDLALEGSDSGTIAAGGEMRFKIQATCDAWATDQSLDISTADRDGNHDRTRSDYATYETRDGTLFTFLMTQGSGGAATSVVSGEARRDPARGTVTVRYTRPAGRVLHLPSGTLFPMAHTAAILRAAESGTRSLSPLLFDGTGTDGAEYTHVTILGWARAEPPVPNPALSGMESGRIHIAFYPLADHALSPEYEIGARWFANGVSDGLDMDFGNFRLRGTAREVTLLPGPVGCR